jgi:hypothetical protein
MSTTNSPDTTKADRLAVYRARAESARREANRANGEARASYLFLADQWEQLAQLQAAQQQRSGASGGFG